MDESIFRTVSLFSVHSLISVIGQEQVQERVNALSLAVVVGDTAIQQIDGGVVLNEINGTSSVQADRATEGEEKDEINGDEMEIIDSSNNHAVTSVDENNGEENKNEDGNAMITEEVEEEEEEEEEEELSLSIASQSYDNGISFNGNFSSSKSKSLSVSNMTPAVKEKIEVLSRKSLQLLSQLCISEPALLKVLFSIYGAAASANKILLSADPGSDSSSTTELKKVELKVEGEKGKEDSSSSGEKVRVESKYTIVCDMIEAELSNIIPIISKRKESALIFSMLSSSDNDPYVRTLLEISTEIMCSDYSVPANAELIKAVRLYTESSLFLRSLEGYDEFNNKNENSIENEKTIDSNNSIFEETKKTATLRMFFPLLGGFEYSELIALLPNLLISFGDQPEVIKTAFKRMFSARPPPLSRAKLFAALHR